MIKFDRYLIRAQINNILPVSCDPIILIPALSWQHCWGWQVLPSHCALCPHLHCREGVGEQERRQALCLSESLFSRTQSSRSRDPCCPPAQSLSGLGVWMTAAAERLSPPVFLHLIQSSREMTIFCLFQETEGTPALQDYLPSSCQA